MEIINKYKQAMTIYNKTKGKIYNCVDQYNYLKIQ